MAVELAAGEIQVLQVLTIVVFAPLVSGGIAHLEARSRDDGARGSSSRTTTWPSCSARRRLLPEDSSWVFILGPMVAFTCYLVVPLLIPVLTTYPLAARLHGRHSWAAASSWPWLASRWPWPRSRPAALTPSWAAAEP